MRVVDGAVRPHDVAAPAAPASGPAVDERRDVALLRLQRRSTRRATRSSQPPGASRLVRLSDGRDIGYDEIGDPEGTPLLFFHGFGSSRVVRHPDDSIAMALSIRLIAVDRPGIGLSTGMPGRRLLDWPRDVRELADGLHLDRFGIVGWSGGGPYALACAWSMPERVSAVGLISTAAPLAGVRDPDYTYRTHRIASRAADYAPWIIRIAMWRWARGQRNDPERHLDEAIESMVEADRAVLEDPKLRAVMIANAIELYRQGGRGLYDEALVMARPWGFPLEGIGVPVCLWHGEADNTVPVGMGRHVARSIPGCRATFYPGEAHHLVYDRWREILSEVAAIARVGEEDVAPG
jgi:pimeloyl-ACP methyl ester carboxylesterase